MKQGALTKNFVMNFIKTVLNLFFPVAAFAYASRILGADGVGIVSYTDSIVKYLVLIGGGGITFYGIREIAKVRDNREQLEKTAGELLVLNLLFSAAAYLLLFILLRFPVGKQFTALFLIQGSLILFNALGMEWLYQAKEEFTYITIRTIVFQLLAWAALILFVRKKEDYVIYALIHVFALAGTQLMNFICAGKYFRIFKKGMKLEIMKHMRPIKYIFGANLAISVYLHVDKTMLGAMMNTGAVGLYAGANNITRAAAGLLTCITNVALPRVSYYLEKEKKREAYRLLEVCGNMILMAVIPAAIGLACISKTVIVLVCGSEFTSAYPALVVLALSVIFSVYNNFWVWQILIPFNKEKQVFAGTIGSAVVNCGLNFIWIPAYGILGAAIATLVSEIGLTLLCVYWGKRLFEGAHFLFKTVQYMLGGFAVLVTCLAIDFWIGDSIGAMIVKIAASMANYFLLLVLMRNEYLRKLYGTIQHIADRSEKD